MLPISKHRTLVIPHRLALVAAAVCLALSFTADRSTVETQLQSELGEPVEAIEPADTAPAPIAHGDKPSNSRSGGGDNLSLLPWFSGLSRR
jgi:hypothetical protein